MPTRKEKLLQFIDPVSQVGAEIGSLDKPIITRRMGQIRYIDHDTTEALRLKYAGHSKTVNLSKIVDVDYVWGEKSLADLLGAEAPLDYVIASHVIEHVPDFVGWLSEIRAILKPGGILSLAIPDKRRCFDYQRQLTRTADVVEAYLRRYRTPSPQQIFDHCSSAISFRGETAWDGAVDASEFVNFHSLEQAWDVTKSAFATGSYYDVHCWVFTPTSFFKLLSDLVAINLLKFEVAQFYDTEGCEFLVSLRATDVPDRAEIENFSAALTSEAPPLTPLESESILQELQSLQKQLQTMKNSKLWKIRAILYKVKKKLSSLGR